jgi:cellulose synthase/poly-beta-1,6-N-acetylglucosamine synthase-like glycosyltransferase
MEIFERMHDNIGLSHCFGSGYIVRRSALKEIGGWPKVPVGEDIYCSHMLAGHGWGIAFLKEFVQYGLTAGSFESLSKQRMRWVGGNPAMATTMMVWSWYRSLTKRSRPTATCS